MSTSSPLAERIGSQTPRLHLRPANVASSVAAEAVELAESIGLVLDPWQQLAVTDILAERANPAGSPAAFEACILAPRQNGKGAILECVELAWLFLTGERLVLHSAHEFKTANEAFLRIASLIDQAPDLRRKVARIRYANGEQGIDLKSGQRLKFVARSRGSGRGFSGDKIVLDEALWLDAPAMAALLPTMSARPNPQLVYASSAPLATSTFLLGVRRRAQKMIDAGEQGRLAYLEWSADPDADMSDPDTWAQANPALGYRIPLEFIADEYAVMQDTPREFGRERLGIPDEDDNDVQAAVPLDAWHRCADPDSQIIGTPTFALDVSPERSWASFAVAGSRADGKRHVEVVDRRPGTGWIVDRAVELFAKWRSPIIIDPKSPAGALARQFADRGVDVVEITFRDLVNGCGAFEDAVINDSLRHLGQGSLNAAMIGATKRTVGGATAWARSASADITPLVAATLAFWASTETKTTPEVWAAFD